jgi:hypothetical protein
MKQPNVAAAAENSSEPENGDKGDAAANMSKYHQNLVIGKQSVKEASTADAGSTELYPKDDWR